jgi:GT2 family glycosyltransferase
VVDHNGGELTTRALRAIADSGWAGGELEIVLVDNASTPRFDASGLAGVSVLRLSENLGFAGGANLGIGDLADADFVALVNNDAVVSEGWLDSLVAALDDDPNLGAAAAKVRFTGRYRRLELECNPHVPGRGDHRPLGVRYHGADLPVRLVEGFYGPEGGYQWTGPTASAYVAVDPAAPATTCSVRLSADRPVTVRLVSGGAVREHRVTVDPAWYEAPLDGEPMAVINNVGTVLRADGYGADRGYEEPDDGRYDKAEDVFAWCGCAVLLRADYLREVGTFDERLFLYYEDLELSWRGVRRGWRYRYVPESVVEHEHSATAISGSDLAEYYKERNRLLVLTRHASAGMALRAAVRFVLSTFSYARRDLVVPLRRGRRPHGVIVRRRLRSFGGYVRLAPAMVASRRRDRARLPLAAKVR